MTRRRRRTCRDKQRHETKDGARDQLEGLVRRGASRSPLQVYKCPFCGFYHVGHRFGSGGRRR